MNIVKRIALAVVFLLCAGTAADATPMLFLVRHAEKASDGGHDPGLSGLGQQRAEALARMLKDVGIAAIFTTEFKRTQATAAPLAEATHVTATVIPGKEVQALVEKLRACKSNVLIVGHSNTIPDLIKALGIQTTVNISDDDYDELFAITMTEPPQLARLHYGNCASELSH